MNTRSLLRIGLLVVSVSFIAITVPESRTEGAESKPQRGPDFKKLMMEEAKAIDTLNMKNVAPFHAKDPDNVFFDIAPLKYNGWAEYEEGTQKLMSQWSSMKCTINDDARTHQQGTLAWGTATWHCAIVQRDGSRELMDGRWTVIWEKRGNDWLVVHEHFSVPLSPSSETARQ